LLRPPFTGASIQCFELLLTSPLNLPAPVKVAVEAAVRQGWDAIIGSDGAFVGMRGFGVSAPYQELYKHFGITPEKVAEAALTKLNQR